MKVSIEDEGGKKYLRFEPEDTYGAYQLGMIVGAGKLVDVRTESVPRTQQLLSVKFTILDLAYALQGKQYESIKD